MRAAEAPASPGTSSTPEPGPRRGALVLAGVTTLIGIVVALAAAGFAGGLVPDAQFDPGALVRYGLPAVKTIHDLAAAATVGFLVTATWIVSARPDPDPDSIGGPRQVLARAAVAASVVWTLAGVAKLILTASDVSGLPPGTPGFGRW